MRLHAEYFELEERGASPEEMDAYHERAMADAAEQNRKALYNPSRSPSEMSDTEIFDRLHELENTGGPGGLNRTDEEWDEMDALTAEMMVRRGMEKPSWAKNPPVHLTKPEKKRLTHRLHRELDKIPVEMRQTGPTYRRRVAEEYNRAMFRMQRSQPELAAAHVAAAQAAAGLLGEVSTLTFDDVTRREQELLTRHWTHNPSARTGSSGSQDLARTRNPAGISPRTRALCRRIGS